MKNNKFNFEKEIKSFEKQLTKLDKNVREKLGDEFNNEIASLILRKTKEVKNKIRLDKIDSQKNVSAASKILAKDIIKTLPSWVKEELENSIIIGNSRKVVQTPDKRKYHLDNKLNNLSGGEWTFFLNSVKTTRYPTSGKDLMPMKFVKFTHHLNLLN